MTVHAVVRCVQLALEEPGRVSVGKGARADRLEVARPGEELAGALSPESVWLSDGFLVEGMILVEICGRDGANRINKVPCGGRIILIISLKFWEKV